MLFNNFREMDTEKYDEVIFIDDDPIFNFLNKKIVSTASLQLKVLVFDQALKALKHVQAVDRQRGFARRNLIFLDINMPEVDGWAFLKLFEDMPADSKRDFVIFMLSSSGDPTDKVNAKQFPPVKGFISKPLTVDVLRSIVISKASQ